mmetsp:Transcript_21512/g.50940  ORF Transcript_21512/g.50940 Transcript_21512/m.50940 type:complete len:521 (-) Transcript_21512:53-1615(-)
MHIVGIDFGNTYSCVAAFHTGRSEVVPNPNGNRTTPSIVGFGGDTFVVGETAVAQGVKDAKNTVHHIKRLLGAPWTEELAAECSKFDFTVKEKSGKPAVEVTHKGAKTTFEPEELCSMVIKKLVESAEGMLGGKVSSAVVTVPPHFGEQQRQAMVAACERVGLKVLRVMNKPVAAAVAYGLDSPVALDRSEPDSVRHVLVYDLGGHTACATLLRINHGLVQVVASEADTTVGGEKFTLKLVDHCCQTFVRKNKCDPRENPKSMRRLFDACESAKRTLATAKQTTVEVDSLYDGMDFSTPIARNRLDEMCRTLMQQALKPVDTVLAATSTTPETLQGPGCDVILVGGAARMPKIAEMLERKLGRAPNRSMTPDEVAACGAAIEGSLLAHVLETAVDPTVPVVSLPSLSAGVGLQTADGRMQPVLHRGVALPAQTTLSVMAKTGGVRLVVVEEQVDGDTAGDGTRACGKQLGVITLGGLDVAAHPDGVKVKINFEAELNGGVTVKAESGPSSATLELPPPTA